MSGKRKTSLSLCVPLFSVVSTVTTSPQYARLQPTLAPRSGSGWWPGLQSRPLASSSQLVRGTRKPPAPHPLPPPHLRDRGGLALSDCVVSRRASRNTGKLSVFAHSFLSSTLCFLHHKRSTLNYPKSSSLDQGRLSHDGCPR